MPQADQSSDPEGPMDPRAEAETEKGQGLTWSSIAATEKNFFTEGRKETRKLGDLCDLEQSGCKKSS